jgi:hypothetical protein
MAREAAEERGRERLKWWLCYSAVEQREQEGDREI